MDEDDFFMAAILYPSMQFVISVKACEAGSTHYIMNVSVTLNPPPVLLPNFIPTICIIREN